MLEINLWVSEDEKDYIHASSMIFVENALNVAKIHFRPRTNNHALGTAGSVMTNSLSINGQNTRLSCPKFGLR